MGIHACNPSIWEAEVGRLLWVRGYTGQDSDCKGNLEYLARCCLQKDQNKNQSKGNQMKPNP